jgi:type IX secretion system PorP/SprF family membrane protein
MMRTIYILLLFVAFNAVAQQLPQYSQYMLNELAINPAVAGRDEYSDVRSNNRHQWVGIQDAPRTYMLSIHGPIKSQNMGLGMNLYTDIVGPTRRTGINFSYAYHLKLTKKYNLGMGLSAGVIQWGIDGNKILLKDETDQQLLMSYRTAPVPDLGAGLYFYEKDVFYFGISVPQMYQAPINIYPGAYRNSRLASQLNINGAYKFNLDDDFTIEPSFFLRYEKPAPIKWDVGARAIYKKQVWLGVVYRHMDAVSALIGYLYDDYLMVGYSYDFTTTRLKQYSSGTHELMLGIRFTRKQASTWDKKDL